MSFLEKVFRTKMPEVAAMKNDEREKMRPFGALLHEIPDPAGHFKFRFHSNMGRKFDPLRLG